VNAKKGDFGYRVHKLVDQVIDIHQIQLLYEYSMPLSSEGFCQSVGHYLIGGDPLNREALIGYFLP
jgi:hypothetical protein